VCVSHSVFNFSVIFNIRTHFQADLNPLFNWNVKQLFLYLTAEYSTPKNEVNQVCLLINNVRLLCFHGYLSININSFFKVVLWDKIIQRGENAILDYRSMNTKYYFWDDGNGLK